MEAGSASSTRISHFDLHEVIGSGGMGVVYRATDVHLGRTVALKFIRPRGDAGDDVARRLLEEARAASSIDHPNICTIFEAGDSPDGEIFIAMAFYEGQTLDRVLRDGPLPLARALPIAIQTGRALAAAHEELIVHGDLKPANIMLTRHDTVKVLDFGLARLRSSGRMEDGATVAGTAAYMAPEQLGGGIVDQRADIWALGVVLFEMLTGRLPFDGATIQDVIAGVLDGEPVVPSTLVPSLPRAVDRTILKCLARDPRHRYERVEHLVDELLAAQTGEAPVPPALRHAAVDRENSIAVLPFSDMSPARDQEFLCDGIAEEILGALARVPDLRVASRTSAFQFRGTGADIREIGTRLNVDMVLEGSVRRIGDRVRIAAQLVTVEDGYRLWYERFDRELKDILAVEEEIAQRIADALQLTFSATVPRTASPSAAAGEAHALYLQGRQFFHQHRRKALEVAIQTFASAIELDPANARAHAGMADCYSFLRLYFGHGRTAVDAALRESEKALEIAPDLAEAHASRAMALFLTGDYDPAEAEIARSLELNPSMYEPHYIAARLRFTQSRMADAAANFQRACAIAPEAYDAWYLLGMCYRRMGEVAKARATDLECIEAVKKRVRLHPDDTRALTMGAGVLVDLGEPDRAAAWLARVLTVDRDEPIVVYNAACVYARLGKIDEALYCLEQSFRFGTIERAWAENDPDLDTLRGNPRFEAILR